MKRDADDQIQHYENKRAYEVDSWNLPIALNADGAIVVVDARGADVFQAVHTPGAINNPQRTMSA